MRIALGIGFAFMVGNFGTVFVLSLFLQQHLGLSPPSAGLVFLPSAAFSIGGHPASGTLTNRFGPRIPVVAGLLAMVAGLVLLILTAPLGSAALIGAGVILTGAGGSIAPPAVISVVLASMPAQRAGTASAVFNTFRPGRRRGRHRRLWNAHRRPRAFRGRAADQLHHRSPAAARSRDRQPLAAHHPSPNGHVGILAPSSAHTTSLDPDRPAGAGGLRLTS
jgi:hypothetical protein